MSAEGWSSRCGPVMFPLPVFLDAGLEVLAQICPDAGDVVNLLVLVGEA